MVGHYSIRTKLRIGLGAMAFSVALLFASAMYGLYAYRGLVKSLAARSAELPLSDQLSQHVGDLRVIIAQGRERAALFRDNVQWPASIIPANPDDTWLLREAHQQYAAEYEHFCVTLGQYRKLLAANAQHLDTRIGDDRPEQATLEQIDRIVDRIEADRLDENWWLNDPAALEDEIENLRGLVTELPSHLHERLHHLSGEVASRYRVAIMFAWGTGVSSLLLMIWGIQFFRTTVARPLHHLVEESRLIARGNFHHQIESPAPDEIGELADALNDMTTRFRDIRDDLDRQVHQRSQEVVRSEQLASVGFLAAGVAHEINNPLASIALCSESLEGRLQEMIDTEGPDRPDWDIVSSYLEMIQREAFRCKQITGKLLDFSRMGDSQRHATELRDLVGGVIEMVQHLGRYNNKECRLLDGEPVVAEVNPQEMKQVVLNLITNGLDSVDSGGHVEIAVDKHEGMARIVVEDNGCGMSEEVRQHLFEPFFTKRPDGQGTGLGLSISYRIVQEHCGTLVAESEGEDRGSRFVVELPPRAGGAPRQAA